jgi:molybdenum cofactor cytidylyltransferase
MIFADVPLDEAEGALLAHGQLVGNARWPKGRILTASDLAAARAAGLTRLTIARLEPDDIGEDAAASQLATALAGPGTIALPPAHGRANLAARADGVLTFDPQSVHAINLLDEALTLGTLPPHSRVTAGDIIATIKIIRYAVAGPVQTQALDLARPLAVHPFHTRAITLIATRLPGLADKAIAKTARITRARVESLGCHFHDAGHVPHDTAAIAAALPHLPGDILLIVGASASVDRGDVIPAAVTAAGGDILRLGMPVDPGNMLVLGRLGTRPVIGLPGCARSPKRNGLDLVLERLVAGLSVTACDIALMGVGGLLPEAERPLPRS